MPGLELDDVAVRVRGVAPRQATAVLRRHGDDIAEGRAAAGFHGLEGRGHVRDHERDVAPPGPVGYGRFRIGRHRVVAEDLEGGAVVAATRQAQVGAPQVRAGQAGRAVEVGAGDVPLGTDLLHPEDVAVEVGEALPVARGHVHVPEPGAVDPHADTVASPPGGQGA